MSGKMNGIESMGFGDSFKKFAPRNGFWMTHKVAAVCVVLALLLALATGLIGHFATKNTTKCRGNSTPPPPTTKLPSTTTAPTNPTTVAPTGPPLAEEFRLPKNIVPTHYNLRFQPYIYPPAEFNSTFDGRMEVLIDCKIATDVIILNVNGPVPVQSTIVLERIPANGSKENIPIKRHEIDPRVQFLRIYVAKQLVAKQSYSLRMDFRAELNNLNNNVLNGLYASWYYVNGTKIYLASTHFEPDSARKAYPSFDEPAFKATFSVTLLRKAHYSSLSNMPLASSNIRNNGWVEDTFEKSVVMSNYLLCFAITDYVSLNTTSSRGVPIRIWTRRDLVHTAEYAKNVSGPILDWFEEYLGVNYTLPKVDHISIPFFRAGAMENWGLITYREEILLYDPQNSPTSQRQRTAVVIGHEMAHQWFGNLVTCEYWDSTWLNEGFATYFGYAGFQKAEPNWPMDDLFTYSVADVWGLDASVTSHPVVFNVTTMSSIRLGFSRQSYAKGGSLIRMMIGFLTTDTFRKGLKIYLDRHKFGNVVSDDLFQALTEAAKSDNQPIDLKKVMDPWILQMGYPVLTINNTDGKKASVTPNHFLLNPSETGSRPPSKFNYQWTAPLSYAFSNESKPSISPRLWLQPGKTGSISLPNQPSWWLLGNIKRTSFFRVNYDQKNREKLSNQLRNNPERIPVLNRMSFLDDTFALSRSGAFDLTVPLEATKYLRKEQNHIPWGIAVANLDRVELLLGRYPVYALLQNYMRTLIDEPYRAVYWNESVTDDHMEKYSRQSILSTACYFENADCLQQAMTRFQELKSSGVNTIHPDLRPTVYFVAARFGTPGDWEYMFERFINETFPGEKATLIDSLVWTRTPWQLSRLIEVAENRSRLYATPAVYLMTRMASNNVGRPIVWDYIRGKWNSTVLAFGRNNILQAVVNGFSTEYDLKQLDDFIAENPGENFSAARNTVLENIQWIKDNKPRLEEWLWDQEPSNPIYD